MATEKIGIYRKWLDPVPKENGVPIPKNMWPQRRRYRWVLRWYGSNGRRYGKVFRTRKEAERHAVELQGRVNAGRADRPTKVALREFAREHEKVMTGQIACATLQIQMQVLRLFEKYIGGSVWLHRLRPRDAEAFVADRLRAGLSTATVNKYIRTLRRVFNLAIEPRGYLQEGQNPFARIGERKKSQRPVRYVSVEEYRAAMNAAKKLWWKALISLAYGSGLRRGEILNLTWSDIEFDAQLIRIVPKKQDRHILEWEPKDHEMRTVPVSDGAIQLLADLQLESEEGHPYAFIPPKRLELILRRRRLGKWRTTSEIINNMNRDFEVITRRAGVNTYTIHDLRRSAITNWAQKLPIQVVQQLAGHSDISTTRKYYLTVRPEDMTSATEILNNLVAEACGD